MTRLFRAVLALSLAALPLAATAEKAPILVEYRTDSGSLPPEYAWETTVTILADGELTLRHCTGYATEGPACTQRRARVREAALEAIRLAAAESGLAEAPAQESAEVIVGSGSTGGRVFLNGTEIALLSQPAAPDVARVGAVVTAIEAAIPARFDRFLQD
jgi:hypothetical protein